MQSGVEFNMPLNTEQAGQQKPIHEKKVCNTNSTLHCKKMYKIPGFVLTKLGLGKLFPARESLISDIPAGDGNT